MKRFWVLMIMACREAPDVGCRFVQVIHLVEGGWGSSCDFMLGVRYVDIGCGVFSLC